MDEQKKQWQKPILIVIGRGKPEENVLQGCKNPAKNGPGDAAGEFGCKTTQTTPCARPGSG
jgi:hypothetical protein